MDQGKVRKQFNVRATATGSFPPAVLSGGNVDDIGFGDNFAEEKAKTTFHRVLVEQVLPTFMDRDKALDLLEEHVTNNLLKANSCNVRLTVDGETILSTEGGNSAGVCIVDCFV